jgi:catechol 2,3-dioxygenase-like lactoylglutathione lyase family enzyme
MLDHTGVSVSNYANSRAFYEKALAPLGYKVLLEFGPEITGNSQCAGLGVPPKPDFWIIQGAPYHPPIHVAFRADDRLTVEAFYAAAIAAGGRDNGPPGVRPHYHENYYGAFVSDPDGNNIEAVCHAPA